MPLPPLLPGAPRRPRSCAFRVGGEARGWVPGPRRPHSCYPAAHPRAGKGQQGPERAMCWPRGAQAPLLRPRTASRPRLLGPPGRSRPPSRGLRQPGLRTAEREPSREEDPGQRAAVCPSVPQPRGIWGRRGGRGSRAETQTSTWARTPGQSSQQARLEEAEFTHSIPLEGPRSWPRCSQQGNGVRAGDPTRLLTSHPGTPLRAGDPTHLLTSHRDPPEGP